MSTVWYVWKIRERLPKLWTSIHTNTHTNTTQTFPQSDDFLLLHSWCASSPPLSLHFLCLFTYPYQKRKKKSLEKKHNSCKSHTNQMRNINLNTEGKTSQRLNEDESESKSKQHNNLKPSLKMLNRPTIIKDVFWIWTRWHANTHTHTHEEWSCAAVVEWVWSELTRRSENTATWADLHSNSVSTLRVCVTRPFSHTRQHLMPNSHSLASCEKSPRPSIRLTETQLRM